MEYIIGFFVYFFIPFYVFVCFYGIIRTRMDVKSGKISPDWKGKLQKSFRWSKFRSEWGRMCYQTDCMGNTRRSWWEWEHK